MKAVWGKELQQEKNIHLVFGYTYTPQIGDRLELAASNLYRLFVDGNLVGYGPARAAHGYSRLDTYDLSPWAGQEVTLEIAPCNWNSKKTYAGCVLAVRNTDGTKTLNTLNFNK